MFSKLPCGRGPHQVKISPYDPEKHVWIIDDQLHMIYRFTHDGKLVHSKGQLGVRGRGPNTFDRPTDIAWLPDGTYFITAVPPGLYALEATLPGFAKYLRRDVRLDLGRTATLDVQLSVGGLTETVTITSETPLVVKTPMTWKSTSWMRMVCPTGSSVPNRLVAVVVPITATWALELYSSLV